METAAFKNKLEILDVFRHVWCVFVADSKFYIRMFIFGIIFAL